MPFLIILINYTFLDTVYWYWWILFLQKPYLYKNILLPGWGLPVRVCQQVQLLRRQQAPSRLPVQQQQRPAGNLETLQPVKPDHGGEEHESKEPSGV